jgi:hypothetical protein
MEFDLESKKYVAHFASQRGTLSQFGTVTFEGTILPLLLATYFFLATS